MSNEHIVTLQSRMQRLPASIQFRMLHVLVYKMTLFLSFCVVVQFGILRHGTNRDLGFFERRVVRRIFVVRVRQEQRDADDSVVGFMSVTFHQVLVTKYICVMQHAFLKKTGIENFLRKPEKLERITKYSVLERSMVGELYCFVGS